MNLHYAWPRLVLLVTCCLLCGGCWSKVEINERTFITAMYVDKTDNPGEVEVSLTMPLPNRLSPDRGGSGKEPYAVVSAVAPTIADALERIQTDLTRRISWVIHALLCLDKLMPVQESKIPWSGLQGSPYFI
ncbi:hypothetical protein [Paenibacillus sp. DCT19]|uniref:Ger(x)C family spore germination protein n=1 Tax=Paenibacillus sp. DCT19 TaxID=2211212 RepID=UPI000FE1EB4F|nr:hypothetical protein [Paenibacillus sp. DCT19]